MPGLVIHVVRAMFYGAFAAFVVFLLCGMGDAAGDVLPVMYVLLGAELGALLYGRKHGGGPVAGRGGGGGDD